MLGCGELSEGRVQVIRYIDGGAYAHDIIMALCMRLTRVRYSTLFEFNNSTNSRRSLVQGIWMSPLSQSEEQVAPLLRRQLQAEKRIRGVGVFEALEYSDCPFHCLSLTLSRLQILRTHIATTSSTRIVSFMT
ncbi:MAG: hypothetical protein JWN34_4961 [Bryobacterales bacterium]|nr:hypothetical protein [Bryobacterales bacterium]